MTPADLETERQRLLCELRDGNTDDRPRAELDHLYRALYEVERQLRRRNGVGRNLGASPRRPDHAAHRER